DEAPPHQAQPDGFEIPLTSDDLNGRAAWTIVHRPEFLWYEDVLEVVVAEGHVGCESADLHARQRPHASEDLIESRCDGGLLQVARRRQADRASQHILRAKTEIDPEDLNQARDKQARTSKKDECKGDLHR